MPVMSSSNSNERGSSYDRRRRRAWLVETFGLRNARGRIAWVVCHHCGRRMRASAGVWEVDRFPVCGHAGGSYRRGNIVISCPDCNKRCASSHSACRSDVPF